MSKHSLNLVLSFSLVFLRNLVTAMVLNPRLVPLASYDTSRDFEKRCVMHHSVGFLPRVFLVKRLLRALSPVSLMRVPKITLMLNQRSSF